MLSTPTQKKSPDRLVQSGIYDPGWVGAVVGRRYQETEWLVLGYIEADFSQVNARLKALDEIYKIHILLHHLGFQRLHHAALRGSPVRTRLNNIE